MNKIMVLIGTTILIISFVFHCIGFVIHEYYNIYTMFFMLVIGGIMLALIFFFIGMLIPWEKPKRELQQPIYRYRPPPQQPIRRPIPPREDYDD